MTDMMILHEAEMELWGDRRVLRRQSRWAKPPLISHPKSVTLIQKLPGGKSSLRVTA